MLLLLSIKKANKIAKIKANKNAHKRKFVIDRMNADNIETEQLGK